MANDATKLLPKMPEDVISAANNFEGLVDENRLEGLGLGDELISNSPGLPVN